MSYSCSGLNEIKVGGYNKGFLRFCTLLIMVFLVVYLLVMLNYLYHILSTLFLFF
jgi:hypothetical protein